MAIRQIIKEKKKVVLPLVLLLIAVALICFVVEQQTGTLELKGSVETTMYAHTAKVSGMVEESFFELGETVKKGEILFEIDSKDQKYSIEQMEQTLIQKKAALSLLKKGADPEAIKQAKNNVSSAQASYDKTLEDYNRSKNLYQEGALSKTAYDNSEYLYKVAVTGLDSAKQQLSIISGGADSETILSAEAQVAQTESQLRQQKEKIKDYTITANSDGILMSKNYNAGDMIAQGYNLCDIASTTEIYVLAYLPEEDIDLVEYGKTVTVKTESKEYQGKIVSIDVKSEYTPKDMQTPANKNKDSFKIKIAIPAEVSVNPGQETKILIER